MQTDKKYYAKLMLAGEYAVMVGGEALTVPLKLFSASLKHRDQASVLLQTESSISSLRNLYIYLKALPEKSFHARPYLTRLNEILNKGYYIESTIPEGFGVGSSAAVSALVYDQIFEVQSDLSLHQQKADLALIESHFHGQSSGVDALSSYLDQPVYFSTKEPEIISGTDPAKLAAGYRFFLLDSRTKYKTAPLVNHFINQLKEVSFKEVIEKYLLKLNSEFIQCLLNKSGPDPFLAFRAISDLQWRHFRKMIPESLEETWFEGMESNSFYLKLNGSGGGFMLGIAHEDSAIYLREKKSKFDLTWL